MRLSTAPLLRRRNEERPGGREGGRMPLRKTTQGEGRGEEETAKFPSQPGGENPEPRAPCPTAPPLISAAPPLPSILYPPHQRKSDSPARNAPPSERRPFDPPPCCWRTRLSLTPARSALIGQEPPARHPRGAGSPTVPTASLPLSSFPNSRNFARAALVPLPLPVSLSRRVSHLSRLLAR